MAWVEIPLCSVALFVGIIVLDIIIIIIICNIIIILVFCSKELRHLIVGALQAGSLLVVGCSLVLSFPLSLSFSLQLPLSCIWSTNKSFASWWWRLASGRLSDSTCFIFSSFSLYEPPLKTFPGSSFPPLLL